MEIDTDNQQHLRYNNSALKSSSSGKVSTVYNTQKNSDHVIVSITVLGDRVWEIYQNNPSEIESIVGHEFSSEGIEIFDLQAKEGSLILIFKVAYKLYKAVKLINTIVKVCKNIEKFFEDRKNHKVYQNSNPVYYNSGYFTNYSGYKTKEPKTLFETLWDMFFGKDKS